MEQSRLIPFQDLSVQRERDNCFLDIFGNNHEVLKLFDYIVSIDPSTAAHCNRVGLLGHSFVSYISKVGCSKLLPEDKSVFAQALLIHDIGKTDTDILSITKKQGGLTETERKQINNHVEIGCKLVEERGLYCHSITIRDHHERWDGLGYPNRTLGINISIEGRIATICDYWDAISAARSYKDRFTFEQTLNILCKESAKVFDPYLLSLFCQYVHTSDFSKLMENQDFTRAYLVSELGMALSDLPIISL